MAINIAWKFSRVMVSSDDKDQNEKLVISFVYAQGIPLLITLVTILMDAFGSCDSILPNMGRYSCFLGSEYDPDGTFVSSPEFLYFYLIISVVMLINILCFCATGYFLAAHWKNVKHIQTRLDSKSYQTFCYVFSKYFFSKRDSAVTNTLVVIKLFYIMGKKNFRLSD